MAWIIFIAPVGALVAQNYCLALAIYLDEDPTRSFHGGSRHYASSTALAMAPAACAAIFHTGPLAWNGFVSFWLRIVAFAPVRRRDVLRAAQAQAEPRRRPEAVRSTASSAESLPGPAQ